MPKSVRLCHTADRSPAVHGQYILIIEQLRLVGCNFPIKEIQFLSYVTEIMSNIFCSTGRGDPGVPLRRVGYPLYARVIPDRIDDLGVE